MAECIIDKCTITIDDDDDATRLSFLSKLFLVACCCDNLTVVICIFSKFPSAATHHELGGAPVLMKILFNNKHIRDNIVFGVLEMVLDQKNILRDTRSYDGNSLLHQAVLCNLPRSTKICRILIQAIPNLLFERNKKGNQSLHFACRALNLEIVKVILEKCPDAIHEKTSNGCSSILLCLFKQLNIPRVVDVTQYLLRVDPSVAGEAIKGGCLLLLVCIQTNETNLKAGLEVIKMLYDAYPQALIRYRSNFRLYIEEDKLVDTVRNFLLDQLRFTDQASNVQLLATLHLQHEYGNLPIHDALGCPEVSFGTIKVMLETNPFTLQIPDSNGSLPLHIACTSHDGCLKVVNYLLDHDSRSLFVANNEGNTPLHCACRAAKHDMISLIFAKCPNAPVISRNSMGELPIHLLSTNSDHDSAGYVSSLYLFLNSNPELLASGSFRAAILFGESKSNTV